MYICIHFHRGDQIKTKIVNFISSDQKFVNYLGETNLKLRTISLGLMVQVHRPSTQEGHEFQPSCNPALYIFIYKNPALFFNRKKRHIVSLNHKNEEHRRNSLSCLAACFCVPPFDCHHLFPSFVAQRHARELSHQSHPNDKATAEMSMPPLPAKPHGPNVLVTSTLVYKVICHHVSKGSVFA